MGEFKGTPGPWFWTETHGQAVALMAAGGKWVADPQCDISDYGLRSFHWTDVSEEDAALIAAAPDLLEALQNYVGLFDNAIYRRQLSGDGLYDETVRVARAAIARATGSEAK